MALIVETGSALTNADAYVDVTDVDTYVSNLGITTWSGTTTVKEQAIRRATRALDQKYFRRWLGQKTTYAQALAWPRADVIDRDGYRIDRNSMPKQLKDACCELAIYALTDELTPDITIEDGSVTSEAVSVGPISISQTFAGGKRLTTFYTKVEFLLSRIVTSIGEVSRS